MHHLTDTEKRILEAATHVFLQKGKDGARMQEIAERARINKALLHYYFRSKDRLYEEVFRRVFTRVLGGLFESIPETTDIRQFLQFFVSGYIDRLAENPDMVTFAYWEIRQGGETFAKVFKEAVDRYGGGRNPLLDVIERAIRNGSMRSVDPVHFVISMVAVCVYSFLARPILKNIMPEVQVNSPEFLSRRKREIVDLLWRGVRPSAEDDTTSEDVG